LRFEARYKNHTNANMAIMYFQNILNTLKNSFTIPCCENVVNGLLTEEAEFARTLVDIVYNIYSDNNY